MIEIHINLGMEQLLLEGVFQNIHDSFDEIDSKALNQLYNTKRNVPSDISGIYQVENYIQRMNHLNNS